MNVWLIVVNSPFTREGALSLQLCAWLKGFGNQQLGNSQKDTYTKLLRLQYYRRLLGGVYPQDVHDFEYG